MDYISEKIFKRDKVNQWGDGDVFPPMGKTNDSPCKTYMNCQERVGVWL